MKNLHRTLVALSMSLVLVACGESDNDIPPPPNVPQEPAPPAAPSFNASVTRTDFGIPHIRAEDWGSLGYGYGYAYAQDNFCVTMREIALAGGRSAELMGDEGNIENDFLFRFLNGTEEAFRAQFVDTLPQKVQDLVTGFAAGMNRYLRETGVENLPEGDAGCRNAPWVFEFNDFDLWQHLRRIALGGSSDQGLIRTGLQSVTGPNASASSLQPVSAPLLNDLRSFGNAIRPGETGSNAVLAGRDATQTGGSVLLGNPHQPWNGSGRWYEAHLTIPGEYDVAGASLQGLPFIGIGFTKDVAWTHTVDFATRFTLYELRLNPDNPMQYMYDGEMRDITATTITAYEQGDDGELIEREKTFYSSHFGMIIDLGGVNSLLAGWPLFNGNLMTIRDANLLTGIRSAEEFISKAQAGNMAEYEAALTNIGNPVFHEFAADRHGDIFYGQVSAVPHVTTEKLDECSNSLGPIIADASANAIVTLDGSRSECEWGEDADSPPDTNLFGLSSRAIIRGGGTVGNSNNSYWLSDANNPLEGFPTIMGPLGHEGNQQFLRTRIGHIMVAERKAGTDGLDPVPLFNLQNVKDFMYNNRVYGAEITLDDVLDVCNMTEASDVQAACNVLAAWDRRVDLDSRGAQVFIEFWGQIRSELENGFQNVVQSDEFWKIDYDPQDPINTPAGIDTALEANVTRVVNALAVATQRLVDNGVALDAPWREVQYLERNEERVPIHGGNGNRGIYGAISAGLSQGGYVNPGSGNSYIQAVTWDDSECPIADVILVPSQSTDPASPHFADQTKLYSEKQWVRWPFCEEQIAAQQVGDTLMITEE